MQRRKRYKKNSYKADDSWLLPYSDLLTLLLALFIVLFAISQIDAEKYEQLSQVFKNEFSGGGGITKGMNHSSKLPNKSTDSPHKTDADKKDEKAEQKGNDEWEQLKKLQLKVNDYIATNNLTNDLETQLTEEGLLITIRNNITFASGSARVTHDGKNIAKEVAILLDTNPPRQIVISGHADDRPIHNSEFGSNWELSVMRAIHFMQLILQNDNLDPTKFSAKGFGEYQPLVVNSNEKNRAINRRVEVLVLPNDETQKETK
ncbi:flagellar motor protein MotB [Lentibacillus sp. N15]|uniref:flagellar motor protein MotB n=1 Tax=Lentibacillus songyuanensis TaxID=3136161 RepID=UPI0031BB25A5